MSREISAIYEISSRSKELAGMALEMKALLIAGRKEAAKEIFDRSYLLAFEFKKKCTKFGNPKILGNANHIVQLYDGMHSILIDSIYNTSIREEA